MLPMDNEVTVNTKVYTSIEEVISDYEKKDNVNSLIFRRYVFSLPLKVVAEGSLGEEAISLGFVSENPSKEIKPLKAESYTIHHPIVLRNFLVKTSEFVKLMEKSSRVGMVYGKEIGKIVKIIREYPWIASSARHIAGNASDVSSNLEKNSSKNYLEEIKSIMTKIGKEGLYLFIEKSFKLWKEEYGGGMIENIGFYTEKPEGLDYQMGGEDFTKIAVEAEELLGKSLFSAHYMKDINISIFDPLKEGEKIGELRYEKTELRVSREFKNLLDKEKKEYEKMGVLSFNPEVFRVKVEEIKQANSLFLLCSNPEIVEVGIVLLGHREISEKDKKLEVFFLPFAATSVKTYIGIFQYSPGDANLYPVFVAQDIETLEKDSPKFQMLSFSRGLNVSLVSEGGAKEIEVYAPLVEYVRTSKDGKQGVRVHRKLVARIDELKKKYEEEEKRELFNLLADKVRELMESPANPAQRDKSRTLEIHVTEISKIGEISSFLKELIEKGESKESEFVLRNPVELWEKDGTELVTKAKYLCYSVNRKNKVVIEALNGITEENRNFIRMGASLGGNLLITSNYSNKVPENVKNLYDLILASIKDISSSEDKGKRNWNTDVSRILEEISEISRNIGNNSTIKFTVQKHKIKKDIKMLSRMINKARTSANYYITKIANEYLPELARILDEKKGPEITVVFEYAPKIELKFEPVYYVVGDDKSGYYHEIETDPEVLFLSEFDPIRVKTLSYLKKAAIFIDFKEHGIRIASITLLGSPQN